MARTISIFLCIIMTSVMLLSGCGTDEWVTYTNPDRIVSFSYYSRSDKMSAFEDEEMFGVYRSGLFTVSISLQGGSRDMDEMGESLAKYYSTEDAVLSAEYTESIIGGHPCRRLDLTGDDVTEGGLFFFRNEDTDVFYTVYYSISKETSSEVIAHVHEILNSIKF